MIEQLAEAASVRLERAKDVPLLTIVTVAPEQVFVVGVPAVFFILAG